MKFKDRTLVLRDSSPILLRMGLADDAPALLRGVTENIASSPFIPFMEGEFSKTEAEERAWIERMAEQENALLLLAFHEDKLIGNIDGMGSTRRLLRHTITFGMSICEAWRGRGVGGALLDAFIDWAREQAYIEKIYLELYAENYAAHRLYSSRNFVEEGRTRDFLRKKDGGYSDSIIMSLRVKEKSLLLP